MFDIYNALELLDTSFDTFDKLLDRTKHNDYIADFYLRLFEEIGNIDYKIISERVRECFSKIFLTRYETHKVADMNSINNCGNKFCPNCLKLLQASRLSKMDKVLEDNKLDHDLYHIVLTLPNCLGDNLIYTINVMFEAFSKLIEFFSIHHKIKDLDFGQFGYYAALRSLEITYNEKRKDYHPHLHCIFSLAKGLIFDKTIKNKFSYSNKVNHAMGKTEYVFKRYFSEFEITLQKLWSKLVDNIMLRDNAIALEKKQRSQIEEYYHVKALTPTEIGELGIAALSYYNGDGIVKPVKIQADKITIDVLNNMTKDDGYSVIVDVVDDNNYYEVFKYAFKLFDEDSKLMQYEQFKVLMSAMFKRRQVQCYGGWYDVKIDDNIDMETVNALYYLIQQYLQQDKEQVICCSTLQDIVELKKEGYAVISKKQLFAYLSAMDTDTLAMARKNLAYIVEDLKRQVELQKIETFTKRYASVSTRFTAPDFKNKDIIKKLKERRKAFALQCENDKKLDKEYFENKAFNEKDLSEQQNYLDTIF